MQKKWQLNTLMAVLFSLFSSSLIAANTDVLLGVGDGYDYSNTMFPVLAIGQNQGENWTYPTLSLPSDFKNSGLLTQTNCQQGSCVATGSYLTQTKGYQNVSFTSKNNGKTWDYTPIPLPHLAESSASLFGPVLSCNRDLCAIGATYAFFPRNPLYAPTLAISKDQGSTWIYSNLCNMPDDYGNQGYFEKIDCTNEMCVAVGHYTPEENEAHRKPLLATKLNHADNWIYHELSVPNPLVYRLELNSVSCSDKSCVATGTYQTDTSHSKVLPILFSSFDKGASWKASLVPLAHVKEGEFQAVKCHNNNCVVIGNYNPSETSHSAKPFFGFSQDSGQTWRYSEPFSEETVFFSVDCNDKLCLAAGTLGVNQPYMVAYSQDQGETWKMKKMIPDDYQPRGNSSELIYAHCTPDICMAMGSYPTATKKKVPLVVMTKDQGVTWTIAKSAATQAPPHYVHTAFGSGGSSVMFKKEKQITSSFRFKERFKEKLKGDCN